MTSAAEVFEAVFSGLPREGPGQSACTARALAQCEGLPAKPVVLDVGCGSGQQTAELAKLLPESPITGVDLSLRLVADANRRFERAGCQNRVHAVVGDMATLEFTPGSFDLVWSEGAAYIMGVQQALCAWRDLLRPGGWLALTDLVWTCEHPSPEARAFWQRDYPDIGSIETRIEQFEAAGFRDVRHFVLPPEAWWDDYYIPQEARIRAMKRQWRDNATALRVLDHCQAEIDLYREHYLEYGYAFFTGCRKTQ